MLILKGTPLSLRPYMKKLRIWNYDLCLFLNTCICIYTSYLFISARCDIVVDNRPRFDAVHKVKDRHTSRDGRIL